MSVLENGIRIYFMSTAASQFMQKALPVFDGKGFIVRPDEMV
jgi:hypothetical protein